MKRIFTFSPYSPAVLFFFVVLSLPLLGQQALPHGISSDWYGKAMAAIGEKEYDMEALSIPGAYAAINHDQHLGYWFTKSGYGVRSFNEDGSTKGVWEAQFLLEGIGRQGLLQLPLMAKTTQTSAHGLDFDYGDYAVLYNNEKPGMEQSFLVRKRPTGEGALRIVLKIGGDLDARVGAGDALQLSAKGNQKDTRLVYDQLKVWDNDHHQLAAHMYLAGKRLVLSVDDRGAAYPLTVDPFSHGAFTSYTVQGILNSGIADATVHTLYGYAVAAADLNMDGINDIVVGAPAFASIGNITITSSGGTITLNPTVTGAAFVYYGVSGSSPAAEPSKVLQPSGLAAGSLFGFSVASGGNSNGSTSSILIGAPGQQTSFNYASGATQVAVGAVYIFNGGSQFNNSITVKPTPDAAVQLGVGDFTASVTAPVRNPMFGWSVADAGDVNGDGKDDIIVGSPIYFETPTAFGAPASGRVDIFKGGAGGVASTPTWTVYGSRPGELLGYSVNTAGNFNGDNTHSSVIMGAPGNLLSGSLIGGQAYIFYGGAGGLTKNSDAQAKNANGLTLKDPNTGLLGTFFGFSVSTAGDVDNDGKADVVVGAPLTPSGTLFGSLAATGKAYVYYGGTLSGGTLTPSHTFATLASPRASQSKSFLFGWSVANAGNVTGDNSGDVLVGEPGSLPLSSPTIGTLLTAVGINSSLTSNSGQAYLFSGNSSTGVSTSPVLTINDVSSPTNELGYSVRTAGDVDGSGNTDFLIGEPGGSLDLSFNIASLAGAVSGGTSSTTGTLTNGNGLLASASVGNALLYFGFTGTLPITMLDFTGQAQGKESLLNWSTAQEQNSDYFSVERSQDGVHFTAIGQVSAAHNSDQTVNYSFTDPSPFTGNNYYRLNMVNMDGTSGYTGIVVVNFNSSAQVVVVYPNPAHGSFQLLFKNMKAGTYGLTLLNAAGQTVMAKNIQASSPTSYSETVGVSPNLAAGTYLVRIVDAQSISYITRIVIE
jgi:hypothetical protein